MTVTATARTQRPERLAYAMRHDLGVMDGRDHGADQRGRANDREQRAYAADQPADEQREGKRRDEPSPRSHERL